MALEKENILIVDDDIQILELLQRHLSSLNFHTYSAISVKEAMVILKEAQIDLLITDFMMPEVNGLQLIKYAAEHYSNIPKLVITGYPSIDDALEVIKSGAIEYLIKPFTKKELKKAVTTAFEKTRHLDTTVLSKGNHSHDQQSTQYGEMIGKSPAFLKVTDIIDRVTNNKATVLVQGESGTGKELVARAIHYSGQFKRAPFIAVNCGAIPENLLEAELFGYTKGAFTGAQENRNGFFQAANGGTLFLDEIGEAPLAVQAKLLRALQEKEVIRVGSQKPEKTDIRVIAATNVNLQEQVKLKHFREDLYYRLTVVQLRVPPLRERKEDIPLLTDKFLKKYGVEYRDRLVTISEKAFQIITRYDWPGNIRELENAIQRAVIMCKGQVTVEDLPDALKYKIDLPETGFTSLREKEKEYILKVLASTGNNKTKAAKILQIDRKTLREKLK